MTSQKNCFIFVSHFKHYIKLENDNQNIILGNNLKNNNQQTGNFLVTQLENFNIFADYIINSEYRKNFERTVKDESGKDIKVVEKGDIIACLTLGYELGISPMGSIVLGKTLNSKSYFSVIKGKSLGLDPITSISKIYNIDTKNGSILTLGVDIITKTMLDNGCELSYIRDFQLTPVYYTLHPQSYVGHLYNISDEKGNIKNIYFLYIKDVTTPEMIKDAVSNGKVIIVQNGFTHVTSLKVVRPSKKFSNIFHYSLQDATDALLYKGFHSKFVDSNNKPLYIEGKDNWNYNPATMLRNRVTSIAGRIAVGDKLQGAYSYEEAVEILNLEDESQLEDFK